MSVSEQFTRHEVVPDVIPKAPEKELKVVFTNENKVHIFN